MGRERGVKLPACGWQIARRAPRKVLPANQASPTVVQKLRTSFPKVVPKSLRGRRFGKRRPTLAKLVNVLPILAKYFPSLAKFDQDQQNFAKLWPMQTSCNFGRLFSDFKTWLSSTYLPRS